MDILSLASTSRYQLVLLALLVSACGSDGSPHTPIDDFSGTVARRDAGSGKKPDAGKAENDDEPGADAEDDEEPADGEEAAADESDMSANAEPAADAGTLSTKDAGAAKDAAAASSETAACETLTYESFGKEFVETYCTECHNSTASTTGLGGVVLDSLPMIVKNKMYLKRDVAPRADGKEPRMPKGGNEQLSDEERTKFGAWVDCGLK